MQPSIFNLRVPLRGRDEVFLMNTLTDAQLVVSSDVARLLDERADEAALGSEERDAVAVLVDNGFLVESRDADRNALEAFFTAVREDTSTLQVTVLTTLQCNFACDYCFQGDHGDYNKFAEKMTLDTAGRVLGWIEQRLDELHPETLLLSFFGGEPLLNLPVMYAMAERASEACKARGVTLAINIITNGLLLTPEVVDRLEPLGLNGIKITLDGDRETHNRMRPLRGRQGTFDRIIENVRRVAKDVDITIGGNFDESSWDTDPALLQFLKDQEFADRIVRINFKPIIKEAAPEVAKGVIPLTLVSSGNKPLAGTCMTSAGAGGGRSSSGPCDSCHFVDARMSFLREETRKAGFHTLDGVHMGPCEIHRRHAYTVGPEGSLYACPGFTGEAAQSTGHIDGLDEAWRHAAAERFERLSAHKKECGDCSFIPVCGGGCSMAAHTELGDMHHPSCHKGAMEAAVVSLAQRTAASFSTTGLPAD